jgi:hypothetical protein
VRITSVASLRRCPEHNELQSKAGYIDARPVTARSPNLLATHGRTIHQGQIRFSDDVSRTTAFPSYADIAASSPNVAQVPTPAIWPFTTKPGVPHAKLRCSAVPNSMANVIAYAKGQSVSYAGEQDSGFPTCPPTAHSITSSARAVKAEAMLKPAPWRS